MVVVAVAAAGRAAVVAAGAAAVGAIDTAGACTVAEVLVTYIVELTFGANRNIFTPVAASV